MRARILGELSTAPASAAGLAARMGIGRQKLNYHLNVLQARGLVGDAGTRRHGGLLERVLAPVAAGFVVSPAVFGRAGVRPERVADRLSVSYSIALAARVVRELGRMATEAERSSKRLPVLSIDVDIRLASASDRSAFAEEAAEAVRRIAARYHDESRSGGRWYRLVLLAHPKPREEPDD